MATLPSYFDAFLREIRPTESQRKDCKTGHETLRNRLLEDEALKPIIVDTFLQGSYRRATAVRPVGDTCSDVDVITVTNLDHDQYTARQAIDFFVPFLENHYRGKWKEKGRSLNIELSYVELDLVATAALPKAIRKRFVAWQKHPITMFLVRPRGSQRLPGRWEQHRPKSYICRKLVQQ